MNTATEQKNMDIVRTIHAEMAESNFEVFDQYLSNDYLRHCQAMPPEHQEMKGKELLKNFVIDFLKSTSDFNETIDLMMAKDDKVAYVTTMTGRQTGPMGPFPPSGKDYKVVNIIIHRFEEGRIAETWVSWDNMAMYSQLGFFPPEG